jgi:CheY-like chemotaxis protein
MDPETASHAFDPFFTTKPVGAGTGLGLATVYGIVHQSGGAITIDTTPGAGTSVSVFLPEFPIDADAAGAVARPKATRGSERILLVEDEEAVRRLTARLLEASGYQVIDTCGPLQALEIAADSAIDLLATDVVMPDMDGTQLAAKLRTSRSDLPVLFLSGHQRGAAIDDALTRARTGFLQKPYDMDELARAVRATLDA